MEKILSRLKTNSIITLLLGILSLTWIIIDYFVIDTIVSDGLTKYSPEWILLQFSGAIVLCFVISTFITLYYSARAVMKFKKEKKNASQLTEQNDESTNDID